MAKYVRRDPVTGEVVAEYRAPQPGVAEELLDEEHPDLVARRDGVKARREAGLDTLADRDPLLRVIIDELDRQSPGSKVRMRLALQRLQADNPNKGNRR